VRTQVPPRDAQEIAFGSGTQQPVSSVHVSVVKISVDPAGHPPWPLFWIDAPESSTPPHAVQAVVVRVAASRASEHDGLAAESGDCEPLGTSGEIGGDAPPQWIRNMAHGKNEGIRMAVPSALNVPRFRTCFRRLRMPLRAAATAYRHWIARVDS
jgi:hypothetical protein